jgi:hypothetical protein
MSPTPRSSGAPSTWPYRRPKGRPQPSHPTGPICGELAASVAIEQNNNYIQPRRGLRRTCSRSYHWRQKTAQAANSGVEVCSMTLPSAVHMPLGYRGQGEWKIAVFTELSGQPPRNSLFNFDSMPCCNGPQPAPTPPSDVLASNRSHGSTIRIIRNALMLQVVYSGGCAVR